MTTSSSNHFPIVGIGASAGGFDALRRLLQAMPDDPPLAVVIVQHLTRDRPSLAAELLARYTSMQLCEVGEEAFVKAGYVYIIPPGKFLGIRDQRLHLSQIEGLQSPPVTIDFFFRSLAEDQGNRAVGVILSGGGSDGALGIKAIKEAGGFTIAQDVDSAGQTSMPESAVATGHIDQVLTPEQIPDTLVRLAEHDYMLEPSPKDPEEIESTDIAPRATDDARPLTHHGSQDQPQPDDSNQGLAKIIAIVRQKTGRDFSSYKPGTLLRRSRRRMCLIPTDSLEQYAKLLEQNEAEVRSLTQDLLISVTDFFRDREAWEQLADKVVPQIVSSKPGTSLEGTKNDPENTVRIWVPGCATGEEAYTVAMLAIDEIQKQNKLVHLQVFASDIDKTALQIARQGRYPASIAADLSSRQLARFFTLRDGDLHYQVNQTLRDIVTFAEQDLIGDPPFSHLDLICCRNVLIYLKPNVQSKVLELFHFALHDNGFLMLGTSETIGRHEDLFEAFNKRLRIFRALGPKRPDRLPFPVGIGRSRRELSITSGATSAGNQSNYFTQQQILQLIAPRCVLVDRQLRIIFTSGNVDDYLTFQMGTPSDALLGKVRDGLRSGLRVAIQTAFNEERTVLTDAQLLGSDTGRSVCIEVRFLEDPRRKEPLALIRFDPPFTDPRRIEPEMSVRPNDDPDAIGHNLPSESFADRNNPIDETAVVRQLEQELAATQSDLQQTIDQFESSNEEFKASTEEVMSVNEELQSTNEELETSKEELQSLNEELSTVNLQLSAKVGELETKHADLENLIAATEVATVCLDTELMIRWFTEAAGNVIRVKPADIGRPLADLKNDFATDDVIGECHRVLKTLQPVDHETACVDGRTFIRRIVPYRAEAHRIGGLVITMVDITSRITREKELWASEEKLRLAAEAARLGWYSYDVENDVSLWSKELRAIVGVADDEPINLQRAIELVHPDDRQAYAKQVRERLVSPGNSHFLGEFRCRTDDGSVLWLEDRGKVIWSDASQGDPQPTHAVGMVMDITHRKLAEAQLRDTNALLEQMVDDRTAVLETLQKVTRIANESVSIQTTVRAMLEPLARFNGYQLGCVQFAPTAWKELKSEDESKAVDLETIWQIRDQQHVLLEQVRDAHAGSGLMTSLQRQVVNSAQPTWIDDLANRADAEEFTSHGIRSLVISPVCYQNEVVATIALFGDRPGDPTETFRDLLVDAGNQLGHAIERIRLQKIVGRIADEEQRRIGRELHDTIAQQLTGGALIAQALKGSLSNQETDQNEAIDQLIQIFDDAHRGVRELSAGLIHNLARAEDLTSVLRGVCDEVNRRFDIGCDLQIDNFSLESVGNDDAATAIAQIAREAIHNAVKHASATQIDVELSTQRDHVRLVVSDNGVGISAAALGRSGNGLRIMRFRADSLGGQLHVNAIEAGGTTVILTLPEQSCQA